MKLIQETVATGRDVNTAIDNGCRELGIDRDVDIFDFEIIDRERKGFLGLKTYPAKVRVFREVPDPKPAKAPREEREPRPGKGERPERPERQEKPRRERGEKPQRPEDRERPERGEKPERTEKKDRPERPERQEKPRPEKAERPERAEKPEKPPRPPREPKEPKGPKMKEPAPQEERTEVEPTEEVRVRVARSAAYVEKILGIMGIADIRVTPRYYEESVCLQLAGTGLGVIIGRRGETLDALQYLASLVANRGEADYIRVNIDSGNYREKRERTLEALARRLAQNAVRTGKSTTLEPMNPYERRIIHGAVSQVKGATSSSIGIDPNRRVVISAIDAPVRKAGEGRRGEGRGEGRSEGRRARRDGRRDGRRSRPAREASQEPRAPRPKLDDGPAPERVYTPKPEAPAPAPKVVELTPEEKEVAEKTALYGKIEL